MKNQGMLMLGRIARIAESFRKKKYNKEKQKMIAVLEGRPEAARLRSKTRNVNSVRQRSRLG